MRLFNLIALALVGDVGVPEEVAKLFEQVEEFLRGVVVDGFHLRRGHVVDHEEGHLHGKIEKTKLKTAGTDQLNSIEFIQPVVTPSRTA